MNANFTALLACGCLVTRRYLIGGTADRLICLDHGSQKVEILEGP